MQKEKSNDFKIFTEKNNGIEKTFQFYRFLKMKKTFILLILELFSSISTSAQVVRVGIFGIGLGGSDDKGTACVHLVEASYASIPNADYGGYFVKAGSWSESKELHVVRYGLQGKYYFMIEKFKPFIGLQAGLMSGSFYFITDSDYRVKKGTKLQVVPQAGFRVGPLNIWVSYQSVFMVNGGLVFGFGKFK